MIKNLALTVSSPAYFKRLKLVMKLITMLFLFGTIQVFTASAANAGRIVFSDDFQQIAITGRVTDLVGTPLPGVNIVERGTTNGAITGPDGKYSINVASTSSVLSFSFIGFATKEVTVGAQKTVDVTLTESVSYLDEVVVVGYSTQARKSLTGSVSTVNAAALSESAATNPITRLQGKVAGVTILNQHTPGEGSTIRIRGMTTINDASPLYVVDGIPGGYYSPNDVESITILKDAAAQSIYGARAANGVVLITTKAGKRNQKVSLNVNIRQGITRNTHYYDLLNTQEWGEMLWLETNNAWTVAHYDWTVAHATWLTNPIGTEPVEPILKYNNTQYGSGLTPVIPDYIVPAKTFEDDPLADPSLYDNQLAVRDGDDTYLITRTNKEGTDWMKESQQTAAFKEYTIDITGGSANTTYAFLLGYTNEEGVYKLTGFERYSFRSNITSSPAKWIDLGTNIGVQYTDDYGYQGNDNSESSMTSWCYRIPPMIPVFDISGTTYAGSRASGMGNAQNPVFLLDKNQYDYNRQMNVSGNAYVKFNILKGLSVKTLVGINQYGRRDRDINYVEVAAAERGTYDSFGINARFGLNWTWTNTIEYSLITGQHNFKAIAGSEAYNNDYWYIAASRAEYPIPGC